MASPFVDPFLAVYETPDMSLLIDPYRFGDPHASAHLARIAADGGYSHGSAFLASLIADLKSGGAAGDCYALLDGLWLPGYCKKDGSNLVSKLYDLAPAKSGSYYDAEQATSASQQLWVASSLDSLPAVDFDLSKGPYTTGTIATKAQPATVFCVSRNDNVSAASTVLDTTVTRGVSVTYDNLTQIQAYAGVTLAVDTTNNTFGLFTVLFNGASSTIRRNRSQIGAGDAGANSSAGAYRIGSRSDGLFVFDGPIAVIATARQAITTAQRDHIESVFDARWPSTV